ncbi:hypothetical protein N7541_000031 [Penicillium brevicompactum]|uniref:Uncharacterized protein n=1 Tax=Penicillium brevicompactum TaxID=5074 RepID=A0A9W9RUY7_PENBR|nr:hypothetical protein N7541_000031 [Penicillium brevicompactum]
MSRLPTAGRSSLGTDHPSALWVSCPEALDRNIECFVFTNYEDVLSFDWTAPGLLSWDTYADGVFLYLAAGVNPADGSVAALPGQTAAKTNYLNQRFLSY